jgi:hypothetical protein
MRNMAMLGSWAVLSLVALGCSSEPEGGYLGVEREEVQPSPNIDVRRSLAITDQPILVNFTLKRVLDQLIATSGVTGLSATTLFQQWWDTQNPGPGLGLGAHCDDATDGSGNPLLNGYPYTCRPAPAEGAHAACDPFAPASACAYLPVGLFMRFDLAPEDGRHCGEYRVVFAKSSGRLPEGSQDRNLMIFEAAVRNPHLNQGLRGCQRYVRTWAELSTEPNIETRRAKLEALYFDGYQEFDPVITHANFGENPLGAGQVRTNQFVQPDAPRVWSLREFKLAKPCDPTCSLEFVPVSNKVNPFGALFDGNSTGADALAFQAELLAQVPRLATLDLNGVGMNVSDVFNSGQSQAAAAVLETNYPYYFGNGTHAFGAAIQGALTSIGSSLTPSEIIARAQVASCAGCHRFSNNANLGGTLSWPPSLGFTHVSERDVDLETIAGVTRFRISDALVNLLLPHRKQLVENFLNEVPRPQRPPGDPIGGRWVH